MLEQARKHILSSSFQPTDRIPHKFECRCSMCSDYQHNLVQSFLNESHKKLRAKIELSLKNSNLNSTEQYMWLLKKLQLPSNKIVLRGVEFYIPEICFYRDGEPHCMFLNRDITDYTLKEIPKDRLNNMFIRKTLNERRRKYREKLAALTRSEREASPRKPLGYVEKKKERMKVDTKDAVVVRFNENYEQLFNETDFFGMMERRKKDNYFLSLEFLKNFIPLKDDPKQTGFIKYNQQHIQHGELLSRARQLMKVYGTNILSNDRDFISDDEQTLFCDNLRETNLMGYYAYVTYKIVCFVESFHDTRIRKGTFHWKIDRFKRALLLNAFKMVYDQGPKYDWTNQVVENTFKKIEFETFYKKEIPELPPVQQIISDRMENIMDKQYQTLKYHYGLTLKVPQNTQQAVTNSFFKRLHPQCKVQLSTGLAMTETLDSFRKIHLGQVRQKRPIVSEFKTNMVTTLHHLTSRRKSVGGAAWWDPNNNSPIRIRKTSRTGAYSTMSSLKQTIDRLDELNRSAYDI